MVLAFSEENLSSRLIVERLKKMGIKLGKSTVNRIQRQIGKCRHPVKESPQAKRKANPRSVLGPKVLRRIEDNLKKRNPTSQNKMAARLGMARRTVQRAIKLLGYRRRKKPTHQRLSPRQMAQRKTTTRKLYETALAGSKKEFFVTLDETILHPSEFNGETSHAYSKEGETLPDDWTKENPERYDQGMHVAGILCGRGPMGIIRIPSKTKVNSDFYIKKVLTPLCNKWIPKFYPDEMDKMTVHHDQAPAHCSAKTTEYMEEMHRKYGIRFLQKNEIPVKAPDSSVCDFYAFGNLKQQLSDHKIESDSYLWKLASGYWMTQSHETIIKAFSDACLRLRYISRNNGKQAEAGRNLHGKRLFRQICSNHCPKK